MGGPPNSTGSPQDSDAQNPLAAARDAYLRSRGKGTASESGTYRRNARRELDLYIGYLQRQGISDLGGINADVLRAYVRDDLLARDLSPRSVQKYYDYISGWLGWAQREGLVDQHYGIQERAREPLPDIDTRKDSLQQTWREDHRQAILEFVDECAHDAIDADGLDAYKQTRNRAMVYVLAYSGVRGSELLANPEDDRRDGARWHDLGADLASLTVLGKTQEWEDRSIPPQAHSAIKQWERVLEPASDWPLIPTLHYPSLYDPLRDADVNVDALSGHSDIFAAYQNADLVPPAMTTAGARSLMRRLTDDAGIDVEEGYLQLHGARRGVGRVLALQQGADAAADQLGNSVAVVEERYSDILASERAEMTGAAFEAQETSVREAAEDALLDE